MQRSGSASSPVVAAMGPGPGEGDGASMLGNEAEALCRVKVAPML